MRLTGFLFLFLLGASACAQRLTQAEYFFDSDPGRGNGTGLTITPADSIQINTSVSTAGLSTGFHYLYIRVRDSVGVWSMYDVQKFYIYDQEAASSSITSMEVFLNTDAGFGNGLSLGITAGDSIDETIFNNLPSLTKGLKRLYSRVKDATGHWSMYESSRYYVYDSLSTNTKLVKGEYFFDTDAGIGTGTGFTFTPGDSINASLYLPIGSLSNGNHTVYIRLLNDSGQWSLYEHGSTLVIPAEPVSTKLMQAEYFFDTDPGFGNATILSISPADSIVVTTTISTAGLSKGLHQICIRTKDSTGTWSLYDQQQFFIYEDESPSPALTNMEVFLNMDAGFGNASGLSITPGDSVDEMIYSALPTQLTGLKRIYARMKDASGRWGMYESSVFYVYDSAGVNTKLVKGEYFYDTEPGFGNGVPITFSASDSFEFPLPVGTSALSTGSHQLYIRFLNNLGQWSLYERSPFFVTPDTQPSAKLGGAEYFFDTDPGVGNGTAISFTAADSVDLLQNINISMLDSGYHTMYVRCRDANGLWSLHESYVFYVCNDFPVASFAKTSFGLTVNLTNNSTGADRFTWNFGNGTISNQASPNYTYASAGTYQVSLFAYNGGCPRYDSAFVSVTLTPGLQVVSAATACTYDSLLVSIASSETYAGNNKFLVQLSDVNGSFASPVILDAIPATKSIVARVRIPGSVSPGNAYRIRVVATHPAVVSTDNGSDITIYPATVSDFNFTGDTVICHAGHLLLQGRNGSGLTYQWFLDGQKLTGAVTQNFEAFVQGSYQLQVSNAYGCKHLSDKSVYLTVKQAPVTPDITGISTVARNQTESYTIGSGTSGSVYTWFITGGTQISGTNTSTITVLWSDTPMQGRVEVEETAINGCTGERKFMNVGIALFTTPVTNFWETQLYPNPTQGNTELRLYGFTNPAEIMLIDAKGAVIQQYKAETTGIGTPRLIPLYTQNLPPGLYLVSVRMADKLFSLRLIRQ